MRGLVDQREKVDSSRVGVSSSWCRKVKNDQPVRVEVVMAADRWDRSSPMKALYVSSSLRVMTVIRPGAHARTPVAEMREGTRPKGIRRSPGPRCKTWACIAETQKWLALRFVRTAPARLWARLQPSHLVFSLRLRRAPGLASRIGGIPTKHVRPASPRPRPRRPSLDASKIQLAPRVAWCTGGLVSFVSG